MKKFRHLKLTDFTKKRLNAKHSLVLCTISGGQDSVLTFFLLFQQQKKSKLHNLYCHHFWQLKNFLSVRFVFQLSYLVKVSYTLILPQTSVLTENESRDWRKKSFCRISQIERISTTLTGHTETDTLEKNLNNILRGTSPAGLSYSSFLNNQNRAGLFFSSITLNSCFFSKIKKSKNLSEQLIFLSQIGALENLKLKKVKCSKFNRVEIKSLKKNRLKTNATFLETKHLAKTPRSRYSQRQIFEFSTQKHIVLKKLSVKNTAQQQSQGNRLTTKTLLVGKQIQNTFRNKADFLSKNGVFATNIKKNLKYFASIKSSSFSFSNKFSKIGVNLIKPLQKTTRFHVFKIVTWYKLPNLIDVTNFCSRFSRNKIRHQLLPFMRSLVHDKVESLVTHFFMILNEEHQEIEKEIQKIEIICKIVNFNSQKRTLFFIESTPKLKTLAVRVWFIPFLVETYLAPSQKLNFNPKLHEFEMGTTQFLKKKIIQRNTHLTKSLIKIVSVNTIRPFSQKLFFDYKNLSLNYSQIIKLYKFL